MIKNYETEFTLKLKSDVTFDEYITAYRALHPLRQSLLRHIAGRMLQSRGASEIGSSDVSGQVFSIYRQHGSFSDSVLTELREEWLGWAALPGEVE